LFFRGEDIPGKKVTIMGLGLHGGGLASTLFFVSRGAEVTVTDLRSREVLQPILDKLKKYPINYTLGRHRIEDFLKADLVIKNPAVPPDSPYLKAAKLVETDISVFLSLNKRPVIAVTGSKGKSTTVSAVYHVLKTRLPETKLGGNITVSPLTFVDDCTEESCTPVILELSSWQLADLKDKGILKPKTAAITNIMPDHQNRYTSMADYVADKKLIYRDIPAESCLICSYDDRFGREFAAETKSRVFYVSSHPLPENLEGVFLEDRAGFIRTDGKTVKVLPEKINLPGVHNRINLLYAAAILYREGMKAEDIAEGLSRFTGIPHRMEKVAEIHGAAWYNDSAATIPQATAAALKSFEGPVLLICGGTDKKLQFEDFDKAVSIPEKIYLLEGSATDRMLPFIKSAGTPFKGPFSSLKEAVDSACKDSKEGDSIILSPGATSFGMFLNEFDRGDQFRKMVKELEDNTTLQNKNSTVP